MWQGILDAVGERKTKKCSGCGEVKDACEFGVNAHRKCGMKSMCKACLAAEARKYRAENKEKVNAAAKAYRAENKERIAAYQKEYNAENKEKKAAAAKAYQAENKERIAAYQKEYREKNRVNIARRDRARTYDTTIEHIIELEQIDICESCGRHVKHYQGNGVNCAHIDHCHDSNLYRGVLCSGCNQSGGLLDDSPKKMRQLAEYHERALIKNGLLTRENVQTAVDAVAEAIEHAKFMEEAWAATQNGSTP